MSGVDSKYGLCIEKLNQQHDLKKALCVSETHNGDSRIPEYYKCTYYQWLFIYPPPTQTQTNPTQTTAYFHNINTQKQNAVGTV